MVKSVTLTTPPISVNKLYQGRRFLTKVGKDTKNALAWEAKSQWKGEPYEDDDLCVNVFFYFKDKRMLDIDGGLKALFDCLTGVMWVDDKQISEMHVYKEVDKKNPRTIVQIVK